MAMEAKKMSSWKKLLIQFGVCFAIGLLVGSFTPQKWQLLEENSALKADVASTVATALPESKTSAVIGNTFSGTVLRNFNPQQL